MATKTISIDLEAYRRLKDVKRENESFSQTIKRVVRKPFDYDHWLAMVEKDPMSNRAADAVEAVVSDRRSRRNRRRSRGAA